MHVQGYLSPAPGPGGAGREGKAGGGPSAQRHPLDSAAALGTSLERWAVSSSHLTRGSCAQEIGSACTQACSPYPRLGPPHPCTPPAPPCPPSCPLSLSHTQKPLSPSASQTLARFLWETVPVTPQVLRVLPSQTPQVYVQLVSRVPLCGSPRQSNLLWDHQDRCQPPSTRGRQSRGQELARTSHRLPAQWVGSGPEAPLGERKGFGRGTGSPELTAACLFCGGGLLVWEAGLCCSVYTRVCKATPGSAGPAAAVRLPYTLHCARTAAPAHWNDPELGDPVLGLAAQRQTGVPRALHTPPPAVPFPLWHLGSRGKGWGGAFPWGPKPCPAQGLDLGRGCVTHTLTSCF